MKTETLAGLFKALSEPIRLRIIRLLLAKEELCVCELVEVLGISQSVISRHLAYLRNHNILVSSRSGVWVYYKLTATALTEMNVLLLFIQNNTQSCAGMVDDLERLEKTKGCAQ